MNRPAIGYLFSGSLLFTVPGSLTAQEHSVQHLEAVTISGVRERVYRDALAPSANKTDTLSKETPFTVQTVTRELIEDRGVTTLGEAVRTVPGLTPQVGWGGSNDRFRLRGFVTSANLKNGFRRSVFIPVDELVNIEQIEVLKGPVSTLYGRFEPGGVVNLVTKKPLEQQETQIELTAGSHDFYRTTFDMSGPLNETLGYRITGSTQRTQSFRDFVHGDSLFVSPVLQWNLSPQTRLTFEAELGRKKSSFDRGFGNSPLFLDVPIENNYAERDARLLTESALVSLVLDHQFENGWQLHSGILASWAKSDAHWYPYGFRPISGANMADPQVNRRKQHSRDKQTDTTIMAEVSRRIQTGSVGHRILIGADVNQDEWDYTADAYANQSGFPVNLPISLYNPRHGIATGPLTPYDASRYRSTSFGLYLQNEIELNKQWRVLLGGRYDQSRSKALSQYLPVQSELARTDRAFSPRIGLTWTPHETVSLYSSWARSFLTEPSTGMLRNGGLPKPSRGEQMELGAKFSLLDGRLEPTIALFDIRRTNGVVADPQDFSYVIQVGEQRSRGWEIDVPFSISAQWRLLASYSHMNAQITQDSDPAMVGKQLTNAPRRSASFWSSYDLAGAASGWSLGLGATYVDARQADTANSFELPSFIRWDANAIYRFGPARRHKFQLMVQNLSNRRYYESGGAFVPSYPGAPRSIYATLGLAFQ
ncbi:TonB-dependent siderophore receptor [Alcaligenes sp. SDU_A2]|uniref:TonB-dependent siderophore receptor n=1 Tax=Alcaligenes sp. SDU_A2 TaxID=3136634 RepID=UPI00312029AA